MRSQHFWELFYYSLLISAQRFLSGSVGHNDFK